MAKKLRTKPFLHELSAFARPFFAPSAPVAKGVSPPAAEAVAPRGPIPSCAEWAAEALDFWPDKTQTDLLDSGPSRLLLLTTRQWGKSTVAAVRALWQAVWFPGSLILVVGPVANQACELNRKIYHFAGRLGLPLHGGGAGQQAAVFPNGSRIVGLSEMPENVRGFSAPALVLIDEAAFYDGDEILEAIFPMLATRPDGALWIMSSSGRQTGFFYQLWTGPPGPWRRVRVRADEIPDRISPAFLAEQRQRNPEKFLREYCCEFLGDDDALFSRPALAELLTTQIEPL
jgi:hypothetical protein